jgi:hypothetical protein
MQFIVYKPSSPIIVVKLTVARLARVVKDVKPAKLVRRVNLVKPIKNVIIQTAIATVEMMEEEVNDDYFWTNFNNRWTERSERYYQVRLGSIRYYSYQNYRYTENNC